MPSGVTPREVPSTVTGMPTGVVVTDRTPVVAPRLKRPLAKSPATSNAIAATTAPPIAAERFQPADTAVRRPWWVGLPNGISDENGTGGSSKNAGAGISVSASGSDSGTGESESDSAESLTGGFCGVTTGVSSA